MDDKGAPLLTVDGISCGYSGAMVLENIDFCLRLGEWLGLIGPNGSGKSTLLKALSGQIPVQSGKITVAGIDLKESPERAKSCFGYAVDDKELPNALTGRQYIELIASIRRVSGHPWGGRDLIDYFDFERWIDEPIGNYSLGTKMKLSISAALVGSPPLIILDESLNGLDPIASWKTRRILSEMVGSQRHSVILSTHMIETIGSACSHAILLGDKQIVHRWDRSEMVSARSIENGFEDMVMSLLNVNR